MDDAKHRKATLQALSEFQKSTTFDIGEIAKTLTDESDRGIVVIMGSLTEDLLLTRIFDNFVPLTADARRNMIRSGGVLSSWADRTNMARALGIIDDDDVGILDVLKAMRNACAHSRKHIDFKTKELRDALCLELPEQAVDDLKNAKNDLTTRMAFILLVSFIWGRIKGESKDDANARVQALLDGAIADAERLQPSPRKRSAPPKKGRRPAPKGKGR